MDNREPPSLAIRIFGPLLFLIGTVGTLGWFVYSLVFLYRNLNAEIVLIDKGLYYFLGTGLGLSVLTFVLIYELWYGKPLSRKLTKIFTYLALISIAILLVFPHTLHFLADSHLRKNGYSICSQASSQWLFVREIVYTQEKQECSENLKKK